MMRNAVFLMAIGAGLAYPSGRASASNDGHLTSDPATRVPPLVVQTDIKASNDFTFRLFEHAAKNGKNSVMSGTSIRMACGMAYLGASGVTATEMSTALGLPPDVARAVDLARQERSGWATLGDATINIANRLWLAPKLSVDSTYRSQLAQAYGAMPETLDFAHRPAVGEHRSEVCRTAPFECRARLVESATQRSRR